MDGDWKGNVGARGVAVGGRGGGSSTEWYRRQIEDFRASTEYLLERDRYDQVVRSRLTTGVAPSQNGAESPWKALKELGFDIQGMVSQERQLRGAAEKEADEAKAALYTEQADRLREQIEGLRQEFRDYVERKGPQGGGRNVGDVGGERPKGFLERLDDFLEGKLMQRFGAFLMGEGSGNGKGQPEDPEEVVIRRLNTGNRLWEALGLPLPGAGRPAVPTDGNLRADILRLVLEDDRERYRIDKEHETNTHRTGILRELKDTVKDHIGDGIEAVRDWAQRDRENSASGEGDEETPAAEGEKPRRWRVFCPHEGCGKANMFDEPPGQEMTCSWCGRSMQVAV